MQFEEAADEPIRIGKVTITSRPVPHVGPTLGYRIECEGRSLAYISDHQQPAVDSTEVDERVLELCRGVDVLIHDAQYTPAEFAERLTWGHCTVEYALEVAIQSGVGTLVLFHHDPSHDDDTVEALTRRVAALSAERGGPAVVAASEGASIDL